MVVVIYGLYMFNSDLKLRILFVEIILIDGVIARHENLLLLLSYVMTVLAVLSLMNR